MDRKQLCKVVARTPQGVPWRTAPQAMALAQAPQMTFKNTRRTARGDGPGASTTNHIQERPAHRARHTAHNLSINAYAAPSLREASWRGNLGSASNARLECLCGAGHVLLPDLLLLELVAALRHAP